MADVWQLTNGRDITVAVIDSGVDATISELEGAVVPGIDYVEADGDGTVDHSGDGHGTGMATLIASRDGRSGLAGVAPEADILPIAMSIGMGTDAASDQYSRGIRYAVDNGAQIINMSVGGLNNRSRVECPERVAAAVRYALRQDVVVVASSGNFAAGQSEFPGACPGVLTVGAVDRDLEAWTDSHRSEHVDLAAPGVGISAVTPGGQVVVADGTSNSSALVAGVVALVRAHFPEASAYQVVARILATVEDIGEPGRDDATGYGLVRPYEALTESVPPDAPNPVFDAAGDLTDTADPPPEAEGPNEFAPPEAPDYQPPLATEPENRASLVAALALAGGFLLVALSVAGLVLFLILRSRRRHRPISGVPPPPTPRWHG